MDTNSLLPPILDVCCGGKMFYFDKQDSRVLFQDIREFETTLCDGREFSIKPDVVGDFTNMAFPDNTFSMVVFDPPHLRWWGKDPDKTPTGYQQIKYGTLREDWRDTLSKGFAECFRVLRPGGFLVLRWKTTKDTLDLLHKRRIAMSTTSTKQLALALVKEVIADKKERGIAPEYAISTEVHGVLNDALTALVTEGCLILRLASVNRYPAYEIPETPCQPIV